MKPVDILLLVLLLGAVALAVRGLLRKRGCGCGCDGCRAAACGRKPGQRRRTEDTEPTEPKQL